MQAKNIKILMYGIDIVFENRVLRKKIFGYKWGEVIYNWRNVHNEFMNSTLSPSIIWVIDSRT